MACLPDSMSAMFDAVRSMACVPGPDDKFCGEVFVEMVEADEEDDGTEDDVDAECGDVCSLTTCAADCQTAAAAFMVSIEEDLGCCAGVFLEEMEAAAEAWELDDDDYDDMGAMACLSGALEVCGVDVSSCEESSVTVEVTVAIRGVDFDYYEANQDDVEAALIADLALAAGVPVGFITIVSITELAGVDGGAEPGIVVEVSIQSYSETHGDAMAGDLGTLLASEDGIAFDDLADELGDEGVTSADGLSVDTEESKASTKDVPKVTGAAAHLSPLLWVSALAAFVMAL